jgi:hypothetical protein
MERALMGCPPAFSAGFATPALAILQHQPLETRQRLARPVNGAENA